MIIANQDQIVNFRILFCWLNKNILEGSSQNDGGKKSWAIEDLRKIAILLAQSLIDKSSDD